MSSQKKPEQTKTDNPALTVWDDDREPEMLMAGLSLADTIQQKKPDLKKRRTLDDMRRLSEHIRNVPTYTKK